MKKVVFLLILGILAMICTLAIAVEYSDLAKDHWAYDAISKMSEKGILSGYPDGTFIPNKAITRAEFSKILVVSLELKDGSASFEDVTSEHWAKQYVDIAGNYLPNSQGESQTLFLPEKQAVREEMATTVVKALGLENESVDKSILNKFSDLDMMDSYYILIMNCFLFFDIQKEIHP